MIGREMLRKIDLYLEEIYPRSSRAGMELAQSFGKDKGISQVRGLETLIVSTSRFSEIVNYIKNQTGRDKNGPWRAVAPGLLDQLRVLEDKARELGDGDPGLTLDIKLRLARGWAKQVVCHFLYDRALRDVQSVADTRGGGRHERG